MEDEDRGVRSDDSSKSSLEEDDKSPPRTSGHHREPHGDSSKMRHGPSNTIYSEGS